MRLLLALLLFALPAAVAAKDLLPELPPALETEARRLDGRFVAPCCWTQTLDVHGSEIALELRRDIRRDLIDGKTPEGIERALVDRFGMRILAVPPTSRFPAVTAAAFAGIFVAGAFLVFTGVRWARRSKRAEPPPAAAEDDEADAPYRERLQDELDAW